MTDGSDNNEEIRALNFIKKALVRKNEKIAHITKKFSTLQQQYENLRVKCLTQEARLKAFKEVCQIKGFDVDLPDDDEIALQGQSDLRHEPVALSDNEDLDLQTSEPKYSHCRRSHRRKNIPVKKEVVSEEDPDFPSFELGVTSYDADAGDDDGDDNESDYEPLSKRARRSVKGRDSKFFRGIDKLRPVIVSELRKEKERKTRQQNSDNNQGSVITTPDSEVTVIENISTVQGKDVNLTPHLVCDGYRYRLSSLREKRERIYWVCAHTKNIKCRATAITDKNYKIISAKNIHNHPADFVRMLVEEAVSRIRQTMYKSGGFNITNQEVYDKEHAWAKAECARRGYSLEELAEKMPTLREMRKRISRFRNNARKVLIQQIEDVDGGGGMLGAADAGEGGAGCAGEVPGNHFHGNGEEGGAQGSSTGPPAAEGLKMEHLGYEAADGGPAAGLGNDAWVAPAAAYGHQPPSHL